MSRAKVLGVDSKSYQLYNNTIKNREVYGINQFKEDIQKKI